MPFTKGKSGNPGGRPKVDHEVKVLAKEHGIEAIQKLVEHMRGDNPSLAQAAASAVLDRGYGKPPQEHDIDGTLTHELVGKVLLGNLEDEDGNS